MIQRMLAWSTEDLINFQLFIAGNEKGFAYLYRKLNKPALYYAWRLLEDNFEIDCITHDAFLYVWNRRDELKNLNHFYWSIRLYIRWSCIRRWTINWQRSSKLEDFYKTQHASENDLESEVIDRIDGSYAEELLELLENAMPYLPVTRRNILLLHQKGLSPKKISKHLGISCQNVAAEIRKSIKTLKLVMPTLQKAQLDGQKTRKMPIANYEVYLNDQQARICTLYYKNKQSFSTISRELGLTPFELLKEHYAAMSILNSVKKN